MMPIKLTDILNELSINNPAITPKKVFKYFEDNLYYNNQEFGFISTGWQEYKELANQFNYSGDTSTLVYQLSKEDLNRFYDGMRQLVRKYVGKEILNELSINNPNKTREEVLEYFSNTLNNGERFDDFSEAWQELLRLKEQFGYEHYIPISHIIEELPQRDLNRFYNEMQKIVKKYEK